jgi:tetratricopeptide (TPR) repeat protein
MDDQQLDPQSAPPATAEPTSASQPTPVGETSPLTPPAAGVTPAEVSGAPSTPPSQPSTPQPYPAYPLYPAPGYPSAAPTPAAPSMPLTPGAYPGYAPTMPGYSGAPSTPLPPGSSFPGAPTPYYPVAPYPYGAPLAAPATIPLAPQGPLARPFPLWLTGLIAAGSLVLLAVVFFSATLAARQDWAGGAFAVGIVAVLLAMAGAALLVIRIAQGRRATSAVALGIVGVVLLVSVGLGGLAGGSSLHAVQGRSLEGSGAWSAAIHEFALGGERAPNAPDIARVYDEWGESLLKQGHFSAALDRFNSVVTTFAQSGAAALDRANRDLFNTYGDWITANTSDVPYLNAIAFIQQYAQTAACIGECRVEAATYAAQGYYQYGEQLLAQGNYLEAAAQFEAVQSQYPDNPFAILAHREAAKAYLALGQQQISGTDCSTSAVATYQTLAQHYADTPQGKQAQAALKAPVTVTGRLTGPYPRNPTPIAMLSLHINPNSYYYSAEYRTAVAANGSFTFHNVKQGNYNVATVVYLPTVIDYVAWYYGTND